jgi:ABC-type microcin C transport system duplicated ATPase subunit YejF
VERQQPRPYPVNSNERRSAVPPPPGPATRPSPTTYTQEILVEAWRSAKQPDAPDDQRRWLVGVARALFREADLLVLDGPTAALDPRAEQALFERFAHLVEEKTALIISHRLGPARFADRIIVMEHGRIVEQVSHDALMQRNGPYAKMLAAQADWYR